jgi:hypothetical protein
MRSRLTFNFSTRYTTRCARSIPNGLSPMATVLCAKLTNRALPNCSVFRQQANTAPLPDQCNNSETRSDHVGQLRRKIP